MDELSNSWQVGLMKCAALQLNLIVGDFDGNARKIQAAVEEAAAAGAELCVTSELAIWGYPARDLLLNPGWLETSHQTLESLAQRLKHLPPTLVGFAMSREESLPGKPLQNAAALLKNGKIEATFAKSLLPTYDVFDEHRYFEPATSVGCFELNGRTIAVTICEDIWNDGGLSRWGSYQQEPIAALDKEPVDLIVNLSASPFTTSKHPIRRRIVSELAQKLQTPILYTNQVGGNDDLLFDGRSFFVDKDGALHAEAKLFDEDILLVELSALGGIQKALPTSESTELFKALCCGVRDYVHKSGFSRVVLGLSGGIDSALTAAIAKYALGSENVLGVLMPSPYSSQGSLDDAAKLAEYLNIKTITLPIEPAMSAFENILLPAFDGLTSDTTEENIQSRIRGTLLMGLANKFGSLLLTTGNKSEIAVGYCTIYGDMNGALAVIADLPKTKVYELSRWMNEELGPTIPVDTITKPPSAELRPDQKDSDSLPDYDALDDILFRLVDQHASLQAVIDAGYDPDVVKRIARLLKISEFKRRQAAPGLKVTDRAFGTGWRMPLASREPER